MEINSAFFIIQVVNIVLLFVLLLAVGVGVTLEYSANRGGCTSFFFHFSEGSNAFPIRLCYALSLETHAERK